MLIEVLSEDRSAIPVLEHFLAEEVRRRKQKHTLSFRPHRGIGRLADDLHCPPGINKTGLYDLLPAKLRAYEKLGKYFKFLLVVVHDADEKDEDTFYQQLEYLFRTFSPSHFFVIGIAVEEVEAWLLGDFPAIQKAYPDADKKMWQGYRQDSICGTWELLAQIVEGKKRAKELIRLGYPAVGIYKSEWAENISPYLVAERNRSPSFRKFFTRFRKILSLAEEGQDDSAD